MCPDNKKQFLPKNVIMEQLREYNNLIKSIGALQFTSKNMQNIIPVIFRAWKEMAFENRANRIIDLMSSQNSNHFINS